MNTSIALLHFFTNIAIGQLGFSLWPFWPLPFHLLSDARFAPLAGAGLGACFYILIKLQPYLENRSFDPKYNSAYVTRFVIGVVAGVILAAIVNAYVAGKPCKDNGVLCLSPTIVAILGGFSAEAVEQVLQRLVEVLLAAIRGDNSAQVQARADAQQNAKLADVRDKLDALNKAQGNEAQFQKEMEAVKALLKKT